MKYINEQFAMENGPFTDDLPIKNGDFHSYVSLPEGICKTNHFFCYIYVPSGNSA